jgi:7-cyano-7-deazaguanine synthase in queuosine biosynthesis
MTKVVRYVGSACSAKAYKDAVEDFKSIIVDTLLDGNVTIQFRRDDRKLFLPFSAGARDLVDLAATVYIADESEARPDEWSRSFECVIPVQDPAVWSGAAETLRQTLRKLSGDSFAFDWPARSALPRQRRHRMRLPKGFDTICLFSGGIDSLMGSHQLLKAGRKVILVGHQSEPETCSAQRVLAMELRKLFPGQVTLVQCRAARTRRENPRNPLPDKCEETHRPRSFLFLSLAAAVASATGITEIVMPENGLIALNPPLQASRLGTLSTRTAHPVFVCGFADWLGELGVFAGTLRNPFLYESKTDMLAKLDPALVPLLLRSVSCSRPSRFKDKGVRHCGYCVPCLYRRAAMMETGLDRPKEYAFDAFKMFPRLSNRKQADLHGLVAFAKRIVAGSEAEREMMVLGHGYFPADVGARIGPSAAKDYGPWVEMLGRWGADFLNKLQTECSAETKACLGIAGPKKRAARS